ncbi:MAG: bifunctional pyr operon transcriptional regulator/uracil phosphoribosyltransferase PyrR [Dehalococcoidia bacterium]
MPCVMQGFFLSKNMSENKNTTKLLSEIDLSKCIKRISFEVIEKNVQISDTILVGVETRGVFLAQRISDSVAKITQQKILVGTLDPKLWRDDLDNYHIKKAKNSIIPSDIHDKNVIIVDDVLYTGRTIRAAIQALLNFGRPKRIQLAVLVDRGHRELPIRPDYIGKNIPTEYDQKIKVNLMEVDSNDSVVLL